MKYNSLGNDFIQPIAKRFARFFEKSMHTTTITKTTRELWRVNEIK